MKKFLALVFVLVAQLASAQTGPYLAPAGFAAATSLNGQVTVSGETSSTANWSFVQSGAPETMGPFSLIGPASYASLSTATQAFADDSSGTWLATIYQNGTAAPCTTPSGSASEFDVFLQPTTFTNKLGSALDPAYTSSADFPMLSQLTSMTLTGTFTLDNEGPVNGPACASDKASAKYGLVFSDNAVNPPETLSYSVQTANFCLSGCVKNPPKLLWFWTGAEAPYPNTKKNSDGVPAVNFGISDVPQSFGQSEGTEGTPLAMNYNLLPELFSLISSGNYGIDPVLSHWQLDGVSYGDAVWGNTFFWSSWQNVMLNWSVAN
jgi:hypothetical protein